MSTHLPYAPSILSPPEMDTALHELAVARSSAAWMPSNAPPTRRPRSSRITKPGSAGNSPQRMPRRRTTISHRLANSRSELFSQPPISTQPMPNVSASQTLPTAMSARPLSWHPSSMISSGMDAFTSYTFAHRLSIGPYETADFNGMPISMNHTSMGSSYDGWFHLGDSTTKLPYVNSLANSSPFRSTDGDLSYTYSLGNQGQTSYARASQSSSMASQTTLISPHEYSAEAFPSMPLTTFYSTTAFTAPPTPDALPIQKTVDPMVEQFAPSVGCNMSADKDTADTKDKEPELIGMGLYDAPTQTSFLFDGPHSPTIQGSPPMGKGLKLEETWEPPSDSDSDLDLEDDADGEDDDDMMSDGMDAGFESTESLPSSSLQLPLQQPETLARSKITSHFVPPESWSPPQDDLTGRSFYMEDGSPMTLESDVAQLWLTAMMTHTGSTTAMAI